MPCTTLKSSIGKKAVMAITGLALFGFVVGHLAGNLTLFAGPDAINGYAKKLVSLGPLLWVARIGLLAMVGAHIASAVMLTLENREAKPIGYAVKATRETSYAARTMMVSGFIILAYIIYHLLHFTFKVTNPGISHTLTEAGHHDVYSMVVLSFQQPLIASIYIAAMVLLCAHLSHGLFSLFQTLGICNDKNLALFRWGARIISLLIFLGYSSIPAAVLLGYVVPQGGAA